MSSLYVDFDVQLELVLQTNTVDATSTTKYLPAAFNCVVSLTMGRRIVHVEEKVGESGRIHVQHTFKPRVNVGYDDQVHYNETDFPSLAMRMTSQGIPPNGCDVKDLLVADHGIIWVHAMNTEPVSEPVSEPVLEGGFQDPDPANRVWYMGSHVFSMQTLLQALADNRKFLLECRHNGSNTYVRCTITRHADTTDDVATSMVANYTGLLEKGLIRTSCLKDIEATNKTVVTQSGLMNMYCQVQLEAGCLGLRDPSAASFLSMATFTQLYGSNVLFTDMTGIVKDRGPQLPIPLFLVYAMTAASILCCDLGKLAQGDDFDMVANFVLGIYSTMISDTRQAEYVYDYEVYGASECTPEEFKERRQPNSEIPSDKDAVAVSHVCV